MDSKALHRIETPELFPPCVQEILSLLITLLLNCLLSVPRTCHTKLPVASRQYMCCSLDLKHCYQLFFRLAPLSLGLLSKKLSLKGSSLTIEIDPLLFSHIVPCLFLLYH